VLSSSKFIEDQNLFSFVHEVFALVVLDASQVAKIDTVPANATSFFLGSTSKAPPAGNGDHDESGTLLYNEYDDFFVEYDEYIRTEARRLNSLLQSNQLP
jgi:hypothetical protein